jgi:hypothetical protein
MWQGAIAPGASHKRAAVPVCTYAIVCVTVTGSSGCSSLPSACGSAAAGSWLVPKIAPSLSSSCSWDRSGCKQQQQTDRKREGQGVAALAVCRHSCCLLTLPCILSVYYLSTLAERASISRRMHSTDNGTCTVTPTRLPTGNTDGSALPIHMREAHSHKLSMHSKKCPGSVHQQGGGSPMPAGTECFCDCKVRTAASPSPGASY